MNDNAEAKRLLSQAIALHQKHMNGTAPTTGAAGMASQMQMMDLMKEALRAMNSGSGSNSLARGLLGGGGHG